jgi:nucleoside phosphorylase
MVDAAIIASELITRYSPKFLIMTGVLGGKPKDTKIGDVIISKSVFTIDKGKITNEVFKKEIEQESTTSSYTTAIIRAKEKIINFMKEKDEIFNKNYNIHFEPIACVRSVIDKEKFFEENILSVDRKAIALEMESYGIVRACKLINNGNTIPLIIKSVMDNTYAKTDEGKKLAAWTSAKVLEYIISNDII